MAAVTVAITIVIRFTVDLTGFAAPPPNGTIEKAEVVSVVDGDTVVLRIARIDHDVRLIGLDTPETVHPRRPVQCYGPEASSHTKSLLPRGTVVRIQRDAEARDVYGRLLLYLWRDSDGLSINEDLLRNGFARLLTIEPNTAFVARLSEAEDVARRARRGLWRVCDR